MTDTPDRLFWLDFESTGLLADHLPPTLLEVAWTITDARGTQLTPLRKRLLSFTSNGEGTVVTPDLGERDGGEAYGFFDTEDGPAGYPRPVVIEMHERSGLLTEWALAEDTRPYAILHQPVEFDRLLLDDLAAARVDPHAPRSLRLAGCGVAQYEAQILPRVARRTMSNIWPWHYPTCDLSVELSNGALRGSRLLTSVDALIEHAQSVRRRDGEIWDRFIAEIDGIPREVDLTSYDTPHRADSDVARALAAWRLLADDGR